MAKKIPTIDLSGISTQNLLNVNDDTLMDLARSQFRGLNLTKSQKKQAVRNAFASITSRLVSTANKRIKRLGKTEIGRTSPAYIQYMKHGKFSVMGKNYNQLRNMFKVTKQFLEYKTSTIQGWKEVRQRVEEDIGYMTKWEERKFWKTYRELEETNGGFVDKSHRTRLSSDQIQKLLHQELSEKGWRTKRESVVNSMNKKINDIYREEQEMEDYEENFEDFDEDEENYFD